MICLHHHVSQIMHFSYLWADFDEIWYEWSSHQWEMTETVKLMITHIFRPPPLPPKLYFSYLWADFHKIWHKWS